VFVLWLSFHSSDSHLCSPRANGSINFAGSSMQGSRGRDGGHIWII
jgi:hypothetical protein